MCAEARMAVIETRVEATLNTETAKAEGIIPHLCKESGLPAWNRTPVLCNAVIKENLLWYVTVAHAESWSLKQKRLLCQQWQVDWQTSYRSDIDIHREGMITQANLISAGLWLFNQTPSSICRYIITIMSMDPTCGLIDITWFQYLWRVSPRVCSWGNTPYTQIIHNNSWKQEY